MDTSLRIQALRQYMEEQSLDACVLGSPENMQYFSGFQAITYSRPILFVVQPDTTHLIIPALEEAHANLDSTGVKHLHVYYEHPEKAPLGTNPMEVLRSVLPQKAGLRVGIEFGSMSLKNARLLESWGYALSDVGPQVVRMRYGLSGGAPLTQQEIARKLGISRSYVSRIEKKAIASLREGFGE